jgi:hypothetical protein
MKDVEQEGTSLYCESCVTLTGWPAEVFVCFGFGFGFEKGL